jgi:anti-sigma factor RsiW
MSRGNEHSVDIVRYLSDELSGQELEQCRDHLKGCANCRALLDEEQELSHILHRSRPLYTAPAALRARVSADIVRNAGPNREPGWLYQRVPQVIWQVLRGPTQWLESWKVLTPAALVIALCLVLVPKTMTQVRAAHYVATAVTAHRSYVKGDLPLEIRSDSPEVVTAWVTSKVPLHFRLPAAQSIPGSNPVYRLTGATLLNYNNGPAVMVTYETLKDKISLLVASGTSAVVAGGVEIRFGALTFHERSEGSFEVITWSNHGLSYALVSSLSESARQSCLVCHQSMADHNSFGSAR